MNFQILALLTLSLTVSCSPNSEFACEDWILTEEDAGLYAYKYFGEGHSSLQHFLDNGYELYVFHKVQPNSSIGFNYLNLVPDTSRYREIVYVKVDVSKCGKPKIIGRMEGI